MKYYRILFSITMLGFIVACTSQDETTYLIHNVTGYSIQADTLTRFEAMYVEDGKVFATGDEDNLKARFPNKKLHDGEGRILLPGMIDSHGHIMNLGFSHLNVNLAGTGSLDEALQRVHDYAEEYPEVAWIRGRGWNQTHWEENQFPTAADLDRIVSDKPVWLVRIDGHAGWGNTLALKKAGITADTPDPEGGQFIRYEDGSPTGVMIDNAMISRIIPEATEEESRLALDEALNELRSVGLTGVHDARIDVGDFELYREYAENNLLTTRVYAMIDRTGEVFDQLAENGPLSLSNDRLIVKSVKISSDGALGSRGAALLEPYLDDPGNTGLIFYDARTLAGKIEKASLKGFQVNIHAIGDKANRVVLDAHRIVREEHGTMGLRHRIEHAQVVAPEDFQRFTELDLIASIQPTHATSDMNMAEDRIGAERIRGAYAWRTLMDQNTLIASGSDFPVEESNPFYGMFSAVARTDFDGNPVGGWYPEQAMTIEEAFRSFTINAAYASHQENVTGSLERGKWADFIIVDRDPFTIPESQLWQVEVLETWLGGERVYRKDEE